MRRLRALPSWGTPPAADSCSRRCCGFATRAWRCPPPPSRFSPWTDLALTGESFRINADVDPMLSAAASDGLCTPLSGGRRPEKSLRVTALRGRGGPAACAHSGRQRRDPARRCRTHGRQAPHRRLLRRDRDLAAHAARLAIVRAIGAGGTTSRRAGRCIRAKAHGFLSTTGLPNRAPLFRYAKPVLGPRAKRGPEDLKRPWVRSSCPRRRCGHATPLRSSRCRRTAC